MLQPSSSSLHAHINEVGKASAGAAAATTKTEKRSSLFSRQPVKKVASAITRAIIKPSRFSFISANKQFRRFTVSGSYMSNIDTNTTEQKILNSNPDAQSQSQKANPKLAKSIFLGSIERARTAALHTSLPITNDDPM
jgi:hypothetical protein